MNLTSTGYVRRDFRVLIDTWWNVNNGGFGTGHTTDSVLIDTWWNVNVRDEIIFDFENQSFNRYMVECEYMKKSENDKKSVCFNRYMVECEC